MTTTHTQGSELLGHFWIRRLHSLSGVIPLGMFLIMHLSTNASVLIGGFDQNVKIIHLLDEYNLLIPAEIFGIFLPLAFHIGYGLYIAQTARMNHGTYGYRENRRYSMQRITAWIATLFIVYHIWHMHWLGKPLGGGQFDPEHATTSTMATMQSHWIIGVIYAVGVASTVYHFANGLWTFLITWGLTVGERAQRGASMACAGLGVVLLALGLGAVAGFSLGQPPEDGGADGHAAAAQVAPVESDS